MSKTIENCCRHACQCPACRLYYCADDEMHRCERCYEYLVCYRCSGIDAGAWKYYCKSCYSDKSFDGDTCTICKRKRRITTHQKPFIHSEQSEPVCKSCSTKKKLTQIVPVFEDKLQHVIVKTTG